MGWQILIIFDHHTENINYTYCKTLTYYNLFLITNLGDEKPKLVQITRTIGGHAQFSDGLSKFFGSFERKLRKNHF